jgi:hypothetical protein
MFRLLLVLGYNIIAKLLDAALKAFFILINKLAVVIYTLEDWRIFQNLF